MPITPTTTNVDLVINRVPSLDILKQMENAGQLQPNQLYTIPSESGDGLVTMQTKVLWTNPNPTSSFAAQSVSSSDTITNYDYFLVEYIVSPGETNYYIQLMEKCCQLQFLNRKYSFYGNRDISIDITNNKFSFADTYYGSNTTMNNGVLIPTKIIGIKLIESPTQITNKYSTEETVVGEWIDGKKIYRKVFEYNMNTTSASIDLSSYNIDTMISQTGYNIQTSGNVTNIPVYVGTNDYACTFYRSTTTKVLELRCGSTTYGLFKIILEYTKTTE